MSGGNSSQRARPSSVISSGGGGGGLRTFLAWLRREDSISAPGRAHSSDTLSVSSFGSDHTAASFAYLPPTIYDSISPTTHPPVGPPTDSYKKRILDRNVRRYLDRETTIHRKYCLPTEYDTFSLPARTERQDRIRRAASESVQRRSAYVPGKRRAPLPPPQNRATTHRTVRKRPAPQPPLVHPTGKENCDSSKLHRLSGPSSSRMALPLLNTEKTDNVEIKTEAPHNHKIYSDRSFFKQIFDHKKRHSAIESAAVKLLPNISELDKQAAEIIERKSKIEQRDEININTDKMNENPNDVSAANLVFCIKCLRKCYSKTMVCKICKANENVVGSEKSSSKNNISDGQSNLETTLSEKQKLKVMLKEMKDSLPKRMKSIPERQYEDIILPEINQSSNKSHITLETPTLRVGAELTTPHKNAIPNKDIIQEKPLNSTRNEEKTNMPVITKNKTLEDTEKLKIAPQEVSLKTNLNNLKCTTTDQSSQRELIPRDLTKNNKILKIANTSAISFKTSEDAPATASGSQNTSGPTQNSSEQPLNSNTSLNSQVLLPTSGREMTTTPISSYLSDHYARRNLINKLERSIASGDERGAAQAATQLAQMRLQCSVLSSLLVNTTNASTSLESKSTNKTINSEASASRLNNGSQSSMPKPLINSTAKLTLPSAIGSVQVTRLQQNELQQASEKSTNSEIKPSKQTQGEERTETNESAVKCKTPQTNTNVKVWIEDRECARGPVALKVTNDTTLGALRLCAETTLGLPKHLQRWIIGQTLCTDETVLLQSLAGPQLKAPFYLCLVKPDEKNKEDSGASTSRINQSETGKNLATDGSEQPASSSEVYTELMQLEQQSLVPNTENFECGVCMELCRAGTGVVLRECLHSFCRECLAANIHHCEEPSVGCLATGCASILQEREVRALVSPVEHDRWLRRGLAAAERLSRHAFHCRTKDCAGWALCEPGVTRFPCPVCGCTNCIPCQGIHEGLSCEHYREQSKLTTSSEGTDEEGTTKELLDSLISRGEALECPECNTIITKKWGCDWVRCSACKTEICWVTRGRRWGPAGRGDTTAGCRCGVDGRRCHPSCSYCH